MGKGEGSGERAMGRKAVQLLFAQWFVVLMGGKWLHSKTASLPILSCDIVIFGGHSHILCGSLIVVSLFSEGVFLPSSCQGKQFLCTVNNGKGESYSYNSPGVTKDVCQEFCCENTMSSGHHMSCLTVKNYLKKAAEEMAGSGEEAENLNGVS